MEKKEEESMDVGTQSQSQMDTSESTVRDGSQGDGISGDSKPADGKSGDGMSVDSTCKSGDGASETNNQTSNDKKKDEKPKEKDSEENNDSGKKTDITDDAQFPSTLEGFGYRFNDQGQLRDIETDEPFVFKVRPRNDEYNQMRYEALGEVITTHVYDLLQKETKLKKVKIPVDAVDGEDQSFVFMSEDALTNPDKLLLLIHGSGVVRAGQWARRLIINDCLDSGTQIPFIKRAMDTGYGVLVLNTNENSVRHKEKVTPIRGSASPVEHGVYVWEELVTKAAAKHVAIVAHSYGGVVTVALANEKETEFKERVFAIALTDSVHSLAHQDASNSVIKLFKRVCQNWISSKEPLDTPVPSRSKYECPQVSAGTNKHEETSWWSFESIFKMLEEKYKSATEKDEL